MDPRLAPKGAVFGTPEYMSPEQARGEEATPHADLYALGVLFFEMLAGQLPFRSSDRDTLLEMQRTHPAPRPRSIRPDANPTGEAISLRLLEKDSIADPTVLWPGVDGFQDQFTALWAG